MASGLGYTYSLKIDFGRDGTFGHALADVSAYLLDFDLRLGFNTPFGEVAPPSRITFNLFNKDRLFMPENGASAYAGLLTRGTLVQITAVYLGDEYLNWTGKLSGSIKPTIDRNGKQAVQITAEDPMLQLLDSQIFPELLTNVTVDEALNTYINAASGIVYPYASVWGVLDVSTLDSALLLNQTLLSAQTSTTVLEYVGDNAADRYHTVGLRSMINDLMAAEMGGRFFWNGAYFEFHNRYASGTQTSALTLDSDDIISADYRVGEELCNDVTVTYQPRQVGTPASVIYSSERVIALAAGATVSRIAHYRDPDIPNARIGALDVLNLVGGVDYIANANADGGGSNLTSNILASLQPKAQSAEISLTNGGVTDAYITTLQVRGTPLYTFERETVSAVDAASIAAYDRYKKTYTLNLITDRDTAQSYAQLQVARFKDPIARFQTVTVLATQNTKLLTANLGVGGVITVNETARTSNNREYIVMGIQHSFKVVNRQHFITYTLAPLGRESYWILGKAGFSELNSTAIAAL